jgi:hypothetical protein
MTARPPPDVGIKAQRVLAFVRARHLAPRIRELLARGMSLEAIAETFTRKGVRTARGGSWRPESIRRVLDIASGVPKAKRPQASNPAPEPWRS